MRAIDIDWTSAGSIFSQYLPQFRTDPRLIEKREFIRRWSEAVAERNRLGWKRRWHYIKRRSYHLESLLSDRGLTLCRDSGVANRGECIIADIAGPTCKRCRGVFINSPLWRRLIAGRKTTRPWSAYVYREQLVAKLNSFDAFSDRLILAYQRLEFVKDPRQIIEIYGGQP